MKTLRKLGFMGLSLTVAKRMSRKADGDVCPHGTPETTGSCVTLVVQSRMTNIISMSTIACLMFAVDHAHEGGIEQLVGFPSSR